MAHAGWETLQEDNFDASDFPGTPDRYFTDPRLNLTTDAVEAHALSLMGVEVCGHCGDAGVVRMDGRERDCPECRP